MRVCARAGAFDRRGRTTDRRLIYGLGERRRRRESKDGADKYLFRRNGDFFLPLVISSHFLSLMLPIRLVITSFRDIGICLRRLWRHINLPSALKTPPWRPGHTTITGGNYA